MTAYISKCGFCHTTQFTQWYSKSAPRDRYGRVDLDYCDGRPVAYCSEEHRDAADVIRADALREALTAAETITRREGGNGSELAQAAQGGAARVTAELRRMAEAAGRAGGDR